MTFSGNNSSGKEMMKYKITGLSDSTNTTVKIEIKDDRIKIINDNSELNFTLIRTGDGSLQLVGHGRESEGLLTPEIVTISMSKQLSRYRPNKFTLCYFRKVSSLNQTAQNEYLRKI
jgi:hypothetical protein